VWMASDIPPQRSRDLTQECSLETDPASAQLLLTMSGSCCVVDVERVLMSNA
jgi:hypothetical protein